MATKLPAKSILKSQSSTPTPTLSDEQKAQAERDRRNLSIALQHANIIQHQKNIQAQILSNIETLLEYPAGSTVTLSEATNFTSLVRPFQPSDFDSLVEERYIDGRCGYALCSKPPRLVSMGSSAGWKLKGKSAGDHCSNDCLRKALYVKSQLSEVPAWEREPGQQPEIMLHEDDRPSIEPINKAADDDARLRSQRNHELALERGETVASFKPGQVMTSSIIEKHNSSVKTPAAINAQTSSHTAIEGYEPTQGSKQTPWAAQLSEDDKDRDNVKPGGASVEPNENDAWRDLFENMDNR